MYLAYLRRPWASQSCTTNMIDTACIGHGSRGGESSIELPKEVSKK